MTTADKAVVSFYLGGFYLWYQGIKTRIPTESCSSRIRINEWVEENTPTEVSVSMNFPPHLLPERDVSEPEANVDHPDPPIPTLPKAPPKYIKAYGRNSLAYKKERKIIERICSCCGRKFYREARRDGQECCSRTCANSLARKRRRA